MTEQHTPLVGRILAAMGLTRQLTGHQLTSEGLSGSRTYRVWFDGNDAVLKVTDPAAEPWVRARGHRELSFYRTLAGRIPLRVPTLLGSVDDGVVGTCLLLDRYTPTPPPAAWPADDVAEVVRQLAGLHAAFWGRHEDLARYPWLRDLRVQADAGAISEAHNAWDTLGRSEQLGALFSPAVYRILEAGLAIIPALDTTIQAFPPALCHGDCHLANVLRDERGSFLWADWAEVGVGAGPADLSFLIQRADAEGARLPVDALSTAYHSRLAEAIDRPVSLDAIHRVMDAFELRTRLLEWPHYLGWAPAETVSRMLGQIGSLIARL